MKLKKIYGFTGIIAILFCFVSISRLGQLSADTGHEGATRKESGSYIDIAKVTGSSVAGTAFISANVKRPDGVYFNNTATTIYIGTTSASMFAVTHSNIANGFPLLSSATFRLDGSMTGNAFMTCDVGVASCEIRSLEGLVR